MSEVKRWWPQLLMGDDVEMREAPCPYPEDPLYVLASDYDALAARVARYEKALNYYANAKLYKGGFDNDGDGHFDQYGYGILDDEGETARHALADEGKQG